ncbi:14347_t:CDS:2 [Funneliformis geosporum]|uniref:14347_t:CDS:1 n=1 Tax=Funneliformis geosporum TaxID=1117311 RepID=A0A9W4WN86_9GLOM|nr:14347_t:CDS:2 [Funneliformis geosporum]
MSFYLIALCLFIHASGVLGIPGQFYDPLVSTEALCSRVVEVIPSYIHTPENLYECDKSSISTPSQGSILKVKVEWVRWLKCRDKFEVVVKNCNK